MNGLSYFKNTLHLLVTPYYDYRYTITILDNKKEGVLNHLREHKSSRRFLTLSVNPRGRNDEPTLITKID
jgi:hypothetical protein